MPGGALPILMREPRDKGKQLLAAGDESSQGLLSILVNVLAFLSPGIRIDALDEGVIFSCKLGETRAERLLNLTSRRWQSTSARDHSSGTGRRVQRTRSDGRHQVLHRVCRAAGVERKIARMEFGEVKIA